MNTKNAHHRDLKEVILRNVDANKGYEKAADKARNPALKEAFRNQATQRLRFAIDLEAHARVLDEKELPQLTSGTIEGDLHRTWMDIRTAFTSDKDEAILDECIVGEKAALDDYDKLLQDDEFTGVPRDMILQQRAVIEACMLELNEIELLLEEQH